MTSFKPLLPSRPALRWLRAALSVSAAIVTVLLIVAAPAGAVITSEEGTEELVGAQPRNAATVVGGRIVAENPKEELFNEAETFSNPEGRPVLHGTDTYLIYWDPTGWYYHKEWQVLINTFMHSMGEESSSLDNVFAVDTQYTDRTNQPAGYASTYRGSYHDTDPYPKAGCVDPDPLESGELPLSETNALTCITDIQIHEELEKFIADHKLPTGMGSIFYLLLPQGATVCLTSSSMRCSDYEAGALPEEESYEDSFCSYHSVINPDKNPLGDSSTIVYGVIPWTAGGFGDGYLTEKNQKANGDVCQDGGFDPSTNPTEEREKVKEPTLAEKEAYEKGNKKEKEEVTKKQGEEGPHPEEPNQVIGKPGEDGTYDTGLADIIINQIAVEQQNIVTDPLLNGWQDALKNEATDECRNWFESGMVEGTSTPVLDSKAGTLSNQKLDGNHYYLNTAFNLAALKLRYSGLPCIGAANLKPSFTAPNPVNVGDIVGFDGMESYVELSTRTDFSATGVPQTSYPTFTWNFGDGTPEVSGYAPGSPSVNSPEDSPCEAPWLSPCAASTFHSYQYGGVYNVTLTITDVGGHKASIAKQVTVIGPPKPVEPGSGGGSGSGSGSAGSTTGAGGSSSTGKPIAPVPAPIATAAIASRTLKKATRKGLVVRYSVSEQVAGHFEVLLSRTVASHLGISGPAATGLPAGSPPEVVIATATLVTMKGGRGARTIQFTKGTAARLRRLHKVSLTLLLAVHNASTQSPTGTIVISTATLAG